MIPPFFVDDMINNVNHLINIANQTITKLIRSITVLIKSLVLIIAPLSFYCADMLHVDCKSVVMAMLRIGTADQITKACELVVNRQGLGRGGEAVFLW